MIEQTGASRAQVVPGNGGMTAVRVEYSDQSAAGTVYLHGGHVTSWRPRGEEEILWCSLKSLWQAGKAIRGGVPICFPWFGPRKDRPDSPAHGLARLVAWQLEGIRAEPAGVTVTLALRSDDATRALWTHDFLLRHRITFGDELVMALEIHATGAAPLVCEMAQHSYFSVGDVRQSRIGGLSGTRYIDKVDGFKEKTQSGHIVLTAETDRVYLDTAGPVIIEDPVRRRRIKIIKENSGNTVVWNPWANKARAMADFGDDEWPGMLCVETANLGNRAIALKPGETQVMTTRIQVERE